MAREAGLASRHAPVPGESGALHMGWLNSCCCMADVEGAKGAYELSEKCMVAMAMRAAGAGAPRPSAAPAPQAPFCGRVSGFRHVRVVHGCRGLLPCPEQSGSVLLPSCFGLERLWSGEVRRLAVVVAMLQGGGWGNPECQSANSDVGNSGKETSLAEMHCLAVALGRT